MKITLQFNLGEERLLEGSNFETALAPADAAILKAMPYLAGILKIEHPEQPTITTSDDMEVLVPGLCILSQEKLAEEESVTVELVTEDHQIVLNPSEDLLQLDASWGEHAEYPRAEAVAELLACGQLFLRFVELNFGDNPEWEPNIEYWKSKLPQPEAPAKEKEYTGPAIPTEQPDDIPPEALQPGTKAE